jgi:hypothetical protein
MNLKTRTNSQKHNENFISEKPSQLNKFGKISQVAKISYSLGEYNVH